MSATITYTVDDAYEVLETIEPNSVAFIHLDDAWARPARNGEFGVGKYQTHCFDTSDEHFDDIDSERTVTEIIDHCQRILEPGGVLIADVDDWLISRLMPYLQQNWGEYCFEVGTVTALTKDGEPDRSTAGMYGTNGGYSYLAATTEACAYDLVEHVPCERQREQYGWSSVKPLAPYERLVDKHVSPGDSVVIPCAGTAPTAIGAERLEIDCSVLAIDIESEAKDAYETRRKADLNRQLALADF